MAIIITDKSGGPVIVNGVNINAVLEQILESADWPDRVERLAKYAIKKLEGGDE